MESTFKIVLAGYSRAGKTAICKRFERDAFDQYSPRTIGASFATKNIVANSCTYTVQLWEQTGSEPKNFFRTATAVLFCFALNDRHSFEFAQTLVIEHEMVFGYDHGPMVLVGTKSDLVTPATRCASVEECQTYCLLHEVHYREVSAKRNTEVDSLISFTIEKVSHYGREHD